MSILFKFILELKELLKNSEENNFQENFENKLFEIYSLNEPIIIDSLLTMFDDSFEYDEFMFSIIHTIETFSDEIYVKRIIANLEFICNYSPKWTSIIHNRILNSEQTRQEYCKQIKIASLGKQEALKKLLVRMESTDDDIAKKVQLLINCL